MLSILLWFTVSDYLFGIFKCFFQNLKVIPSFWYSCCLIFCFLCCVLSTAFFSFCPFFFVIVLFALGFRTSDYSFSIFKLFLSKGFVTRLTRRVPLVEQQLLTLPEHLTSPPVYIEVRVTRSLVLCVCFVNRCFFLCTFFLVIALSVLLYTDYDGVAPIIRHTISPTPH